MVSQNWMSNFRNAPAHGLINLVILISRVLPRRLLFRFARGLGLFAWMILPRWRKNAMTTMDVFFRGELTEKARFDIGKKAAVNFSYQLFEFILMGTLPTNKALEMIECDEGEQYFEQALEDGKGAISLSMHYGNWELTALYVTQRIAKLYAVGKKQTDPLVTKYAFAWREKHGVNNIVAGDRSSSAILRALKENSILGLVADVNGGTTGIFAPFSGTMASTVPGPAALALKTNAPLIVAYGKRISPGKLKLIIKPPISMENLPENKEEAMVEVLGRMNKIYEEIIREDPTQWNWGQKRYKTRPGGEKGFY